LEKVSIVLTAIRTFFKEFSPRSNISMDEFCGKIKELGVKISGKRRWISIAKTRT
jgi:hypothetical protein